MWPWSNSAKYAKKKFEEAVYEEAFREIADQKIRPGIWAKVFAQARGDRDKAEALYVEQRAEGIALDAKLKWEHRVDQERKARRQAGRLALANAAAAKVAEKEAAEAFAQAEARRRIQESNRFWLRVLCVTVMVAPPVGAGWLLYEHLNSLPVSVSYGLVMLLFTTSWVWQDAARTFASNIRWTVVSGLLFCALAGWALNVSMGVAVFWTGLSFMATVLVALSAVRRKSKPQAS